MTFQVDKQPFQTIKTSIYKVKKFAFFKRGQSMVFVKKCNFGHSFFLVKMYRIKVFGTVLHREKGSLDDKNIDQKKTQNLHFSKGVSPWFLSKIVMVHIFFFSLKICQVKFYGAVLHIEIGFLDHKNIDQKKSQNLHFFNGVSPWFFSKIVIFSFFLFIQNTPNKSV